MGDFSVSLYSIKQGEVVPTREIEGAAAVYSQPQPIKVKRTLRIITCSGGVGPEKKKREKKKKKRKKKKKKKKEKKKKSRKKGEN